MNDRIKELARQAQVGSAEFDNGINYFVSTEETFNKFALLLIEECGRVAGQDWDTAETAIYKHFGIEE